MALQVRQGILVQQALPLIQELLAGQEIRALLVTRATQASQVTLVLLVILETLALQEILVLLA
jgi:hypothetical protein